MTRDEAKTVFLNRGYVEVKGGTIYDADKWRESCRVISEWLEQEPKTEKVIKMRDATPEEQKSVNDYIKSISKPTGIKFDEEQEQLDFVQMHKRIPVTLMVSGDLIQRQALLDDFGLSEKTRKWGGDHSGYNTMMLYEIQDVIESAPSVKLQERTGHWIDTGSGQECSECHEIQYGYDNHRFYCGNCGAKMEVENNG